mgnify:CR=1 FL=1
MDLSKLQMKFQFEYYRCYYYEIELGGQFAIYMKFSLQHGIEQISTVEFLKDKASYQEWRKCHPEGK